ncbi:hypothetical protein M434DRAFT_29743 [Hypoxylon sp. CO27-5]|nr:hypothetical protein M434DRAFT_29743 [Hypoxylon sp. CO27-5]
MNTYNPDAAHPENWYAQDMQITAYPMSRNYLGNIYLAANYSAPILNSRNTSLWIINLPPRLTYPQLLQSIRRCGKIKSTCINFANQYHATSAAKVVFFTHDAAVRFMNQADRLVIGGYRPVIRWNRIRTAESNENLGSRVLLITGPRQLVSLENLQIFFLLRFKFDLDHYVPVWMNEHLACIELHFGSWRAQAHAAYIAIRRDLYPLLRVSYACDPCA